jgi:hypothetical protein
MPSSGAVIYMLCNGTKGPQDEPPRHAGVNRKQMIEAFLKSVWPFHRRAASTHAEDQGPPPAEADVLSPRGDEQSSS